MTRKNTKNVSVLKQYFDLDPESYAVLCGLSLEEATPIANKRVCEALASRALVNLDGVCPNAGYLRCRLTTAGTVTLQAANVLLSDPTPMQPGTSEVVRGLAQTSVNPQQKPTNLVAIDTSWRFGDEECQYCDSFAKPVGCSVCDREGCDECLYTVNGKRLCTLCKEELEHPERKGHDGSIGLDASGNFVYHPPAKVLMFPVGVPKGGTA
jgi:hypothetical protein